MSVENLKTVYAKATTEDVRSALDSYFRYNRLVGEIASKYGYTPQTGAAVFASLSPNNDYHGNLRDTDKLLRAANEGRSLESFGVSTYGPNKKKAWAIVHGADPLDLILADKTRNFFINVNDPTNGHAVCVDGHIFNCWRGKRESLVGLRRLGRLEYATVADGVRKLATEFSVLPSQAQGTLWLTWRRIHDIKSPAQRSFWHADYFAAGLGWKASTDK